MTFPLSKILGGLCLVGGVSGAIYSVITQDPETGLASGVLVGAAAVFNSYGNKRNSEVLKSSSLNCRGINSKGESVLARGLEEPVIVHTLRDGNTNVLCRYNGVGQCKAGEEGMKFPCTYKRGKK